MKERMVNNYMLDKILAKVIQEAIAMQNLMIQKI